MRTKGCAKCCSSILTSYARSATPVGMGSIRTKKELCCRDCDFGAIPWDRRPNAAQGPDTHSHLHSPRRYEPETIPQYPVGAESLQITEEELDHARSKR